MAKPTYTETSFTAVWKKPVDLVARLFRENLQRAVGEPVLLVAESPRRYSTASVFIWFGAFMLVALIGFSVAVAVSQAMEWSWGVGLLFAAGTVIGFGPGVKKYLSFGGVQNLGIIVFQSGQNLVVLEEPWWFQTTRELRYIFSASGVFSARFVVKNCQTKADGGEAMLVDLVFENGMSWIHREDVVLLWLRGIAAEAMQTGEDATKILNQRLKILPYQIRDVLKNVLEPYTTAKTYRGLRQEGAVFSEHEAAAVVQAANASLGQLGLPVRFGASAKVVDIIPPPNVQEQEEREATRLEQEQKLLAELEGRIAIAERNEVTQLAAEIEGVDIPDKALGKFRAALEKRRQTLEAQAAAFHQFKVDRTLETYEVQLDAALAAIDPRGPLATKFNRLMELRKKYPDRAEIAFGLQRLSEANEVKALPAPNPNNGAATKQAADRDPGVEAQVEALAREPVSA